MRALAARSSSSLEPKIKNYDEVHPVIVEHVGAYPNKKSVWFCDVVTNCGKEKKK